MNRRVAFSVLFVFWLVIGGPMSAIIITNRSGLAGMEVVLVAAFTWAAPSLLALYLLVRQVR